MDYDEIIFLKDFLWRMDGFFDGF